MNAVLLLMYNTTAQQLELTKQAYESVLAQDIGDLEIYVVNNGSHPETGTREWVDSLEGLRTLVFHHEHNRAPTTVANDIAKIVFGKGYDKLLGVPNDVILPPNLYSEMVKCPRGIVAAWMTYTEDKSVKHYDTTRIVHEDVHMSVMMTRKWAWDALAVNGEFLDEGMFMYASDVDLKIRMALAGIRGAQLDIECWHYFSACWRLAKQEAATEITSQADLDRDNFFRKWGFRIGSEEHVAFEKSMRFGG